MSSLFNTKLKSSRDAKQQAKLDQLNASEKRLEGQEDEAMEEQETTHILMKVRQLTPR